MHWFYQISWVAIIQGSNWLDENFSRWEFPGWEWSGWGISRRQFYGWEFSCYPNKSFQVWNLFVLHILFHDIFECAEYAWICVKHYVSKLTRVINRPESTYIRFNICIYCSWVIPEQCAWNWLNMSTILNVLNKSCILNMP